MLDPIFPPPPWLSSQISNLSKPLAFATLPLHIHEIIASFAFYQFVQSVVSPLISSYLFPAIYPQLNQRTKINWDVHVVSFVQSCFINAAALWVMFMDQERLDMTAFERVYGYTGACGMIQGLAAGYFLWDLVVTSRNLGIFGLGMWAHAVCALCVFSFGFRPFLNFYGPTFILYELSSPFLNIHWFLDKLHLTGSKYQWYNGLVLLTTFFGCRLVWGTYQSIRVYQDVWSALNIPVNSFGDLLSSEMQSNVTQSAGQNPFLPRNGNLCLGRADCVAAQGEIIKFIGTGATTVPIWLAITYLSSNVVLNSLNFYWFGKMIKTVRKRFEKKSPGGSEKEEEDEKGAAAVKRRRTSILLDVANEPETDESLNRMLMVDGAAKRTEMGENTRPGGRESKNTADHKRPLENRLDDRAMSSAFEKSNNIIHHHHHLHNAGPPTRSDATRRR